MDASAAEKELEVVCARHRLRVVERLPASGGLRFVARVTDERGEPLFLKRSSGLRGYGEIPVLRAWEGLDATPRNLRVLDPETFTCEWIEGVTFDQSHQDTRGLLRQAGGLLRKLHSAAPPAGLMPISERTSPEWVEADISPALPRLMRESSRLAADQLRTYSPADAVLLHGDFVPQNILVSGERMAVFDPIGFVGPAGWDVAQLSIAVPGRDRRDNLTDVLEGYATVPPLLEQAFAYLAFLFFGKALEQEPASADDQRETLAELRALTESLC